MSKEDIIWLTIGVGMLALPKLGIILLMAAREGFLALKRISDGRTPNDWHRLKDPHRFNDWFNSKG